MRSLQAISKEPQTISSNALHAFRSKGQVTLVVEGKTDRAFWLRYLSSDCRLEVLGDKDLVLEVSRLSLSYATRTKNPSFALCLVDYDYSGLCHDVLSRDNLYYVDECPTFGRSRDLEIVLIRSTALRDLLIQYELEDEVDDIRSKLLESGARIGALRLIACHAGQRSPFGDMKDLPWDEFFDPENLCVNFDGLVSSLCNGEKWSVPKIASYIQEGEKYIDQHFPHTLARGHDCLIMLSKYLSFRVSQAKGKAINFVQSGIERELRLAFSLELLKSVAFGKKITDWSEQLGKSALVYSQDDGLK